MKQAIAQFFTSPAYAVIGASTQRHKFGNKVLRCYLQHRLTVYPVNPKETVIEGIPSYQLLQDLPADVQSISVITPALITEQVVQQAIAKGIKNIWLQPGAESEAAILTCQQHGINVIAKGPCILVALGLQE
jgi:predicted CoA-binding protein